MNKGLHIKGNYKPVFWLMMLLVFTARPLFGQMTVSIGEQNQCENTPVYVPVNVTDFMDVAAITLYIQIDTLKSEFLDVVNTNVQLSGGAVISNFVGTISQIIISWSSLSAANIASGKLFDLKMNYHQGNAGMVFQNQCEIALSNFVIVQNVVYENGLLIPEIVISQQPQSISVTEGQQAQFDISLESFSGMMFQWQMQDGFSWSDIINETPYSGATTSQLAIDNVSLSLNNYGFRCRVQFDDCYKYSDSVKLTVLPLTIINSQGDNKPLLNVFPNPCNGKLNYIFKDVGSDFCIRIVNLAGEVVFEENPEKFSGVILMDIFNPGIYYLQLMSGNLTIETVKLLKH